MVEKLFEAQKRAFSLLQEKNLDPGAAELLLMHITEKSRVSLLASMQELLTEKEQHDFNVALQQLLTAMPIQHIIGSEIFYGREFEVNEHVLIPRPETEELIYYAIEKSRALFGKTKIKVADIGTGSGAIAITMKKEWPDAQVVGVDISEQALVVAQRNAVQLGVSIDFRLGNMTEPLLDEKWDIILSNPPYIGREEAKIMSNTVLQYEPHEALFAEEQGLYFYRQLAHTLPSLMKDRALLGIEFGYEQGEAVYQLFQRAFPHAMITVVQDINGKDRMLFCEIGR